MKAQLSPKGIILALAALVVCIGIALVVRNQPDKPLVSLYATTTPKTVKPGLGLPGTGWFAVNNPHPYDVVFIPMNVQIPASNGWQDIQKMSPAGDPFSYEPYGRVIPGLRTYFFAPSNPVTNEHWRVIVRIKERVRPEIVGNFINRVMASLSGSSSIGRKYHGRGYFLTNEVRSEASLP